MLHRPLAEPYEIVFVSRAFSCHWFWLYLSFMMLSPHAEIADSYTLFSECQLREDRDSTQLPCTLPVCRDSSRKFQIIITWNFKFHLSYDCKMFRFRQDLPGLNDCDWNQGPDCHNLCCAISQFFTIKARESLFLCLEFDMFWDIPELRSCLWSGRRWIRGSWCWCPVVLPQSWNFIKNQSFCHFFFTISFD